MQQSTSIEVPGYTIKEVLGAGGSATVFLARHHALQRDVALKILNIEFANDPNVRQRFIREALDTASISEHPNIMTIHDTGFHNTVYFIALQYLPGLSLRDQIDAGHQITNPWSIMYQLACALAHMHRKGFVHRDIKPGNVLFTQSGRPILADFGVAQPASTLSKVANSRHRPGTTKYMSPEQVQGTGITDARSDLYSLGLVFHEMLTGQLPYCSTTPLAPHPSNSYPSCHFNRHTPEPLPHLPTSFAHFQEILDQLLQQRPLDRPQSADQLIAALALLKNCSNNAAGCAFSANRGKALMKVSRTKGIHHKAIPITTAILTLVTLTASSSHTDDLIRAQKIANQCPVINEEQTQDLNKLVRLAKMHYQVGRLSYPPGSNAIEAYSKALNIAPCNLFIDDTLQQLHQRALALPSNTNKRHSSPSKPHIKRSETVAAAYDKLDFGDFHALIIGNQVYENLANLPNVKTDAKAIEKMLAQHFSFTTTLLQDATQKQTLIALEQLRATLNPQDNLLIFYLGHGDIDHQASRGYWIPTDATLSDIASWIPNQTVKSIVDSMLAKHILIIANNCYSDALPSIKQTKALPELKIADEISWLRANVPLKVRATLCMNKRSGYLFTTDSGKNSRFVEAFIDTLAHSHQPIDSYKLLHKMQKFLNEPVQKQQTQASLEYAPINNSSHQSGEFIFPKKTQK